MVHVKDNTVRISVRNLVEFVLRSGDIDNRRISGNRQDAMLIGAKLHRKIQSSMGKNYHAEVTLRTKRTVDNIVLEVEGRADGVFSEDGIFGIDEIKAVFENFENKTEPLKIHFAQAVCYGYMYAKQNQLDRMLIRLTYCHPETEAVKHFDRQMTFEELETDFLCWTDSYTGWARFMLEHMEKRNASLEGMAFPFPYRPGQKKLAASAYRAISDQKTLFLQAPTGTGKTLSVLFPSVIALREKKAEKIFYLTSKTVTGKVAEEAVQILQDHKAQLSDVVITAREKLCFLEKMDCNPESCPYAKGHFDRVNEAVYDLITSKAAAGRDVIRQYAEKHRVCPFEMCLDVSSWVDIIICDYNYVFDPHVRLQRFFGENEKGDYVFLVDEAHNLPDRARSMYSAQLYKEEFEEAKKYYSALPEVKKRIQSCLGILLKWKRKWDSVHIFDSEAELGPFFLAADRLYSDLCDIPDRHPDWIPPAEDSDFFFRIRDFLTVYEELDENYRCYSQIDEDGNFEICEFCVNPAAALEKCCSQGAASIFFSATFLPIAYYRQLLTTNPDTPALYVRSPFEPEKRLIAAAQDVSSRYTRRNRQEYEKYAEYIRLALASRMGNYLVFFPSYRYMEEILSILSVPEGYECVSQSASMTESDREGFLENFRREEKKTVGFCVMGGIFAESIDLRKEELIGVIIIGTGLSQINVRQDILRKYYEEQGQDGYAFAYQYPGMNRVLQAAGRLIRTAEDCGIILLLDDRFQRQDHRNLFPPEWEKVFSVTVGNVQKVLDSFWKTI